MTITNPTYRYGIILNGASYAPGDPSVGSHVIPLKTPEQIAAAALDAYAENLYPEEERAFRRNVDAGNWQSLIVDAIETDRAQRAEIHQDWRDDQENVRGADHVDVAWAAYRADGGIIFQSDMTLTDAEAVGMFQGIGEANR